MSKQGLAWPKSVRPEEQAFADLAADVPSSAGFYFDTAGTLFVRVRNGAEDAAALNIARGYIRSGRIMSGHGGPGFATIARAQFSFGELATWRDILLDHVFDVEGVTSLDLNEESNRVVLGLDPANANALRNSLPALIVEWGVDTTAVGYRLKSHNQFMVGPRSTPATAAMPRRTGSLTGDKFSTNDRRHSSAGNR